MNDPLHFDAHSDIFKAFQEIWREEIHEELTCDKASEYGSKILALVGAVSRAKRMGWLVPHR